MQQNLFNAEFASGAYRNAGDKNLHVFGVMKALTKELHKRFCCICACRQLHFSGQVYGMNGAKQISAKKSNRRHR